MHQILQKHMCGFSLRINPRKNTTHVYNWKKNFFLQFPYTYIYVNYTINDIGIYRNNIHPIIAFSDLKLNEFDYFHKQMYILPIFNTFPYGNVCLGIIEAFSINDFANKLVNAFFNKQSVDNSENVYLKEYTQQLKMSKEKIWNTWHKYTEFILP